MFLQCQCFVKREKAGFKFGFESDLKTNSCASHRQQNSHMETAVMDFPVLYSVLCLKFTAARFSGLLLRVLME